MLSAKGAETQSISTRPVLVKPQGSKQKPLCELIVDGLVTITPELALRIIQTGKFDRQRPVRDKHVQALAEQMRRREWTAGTQIHFGRTPDGEIHLVNGQHRMHAVIKADAAIRFQILLTPVASEGELIRLYRRHDRLTAPRTIADALAAEGIPEQYEILTAMARGCFNAVLLIEAGFPTVTRYADAYLARSDEARLRLCEPWWDTVAHFQELLSSAPHKTIKASLMRSGAMAVALLTLRDHPVKAEDFWRGTATDDGLRADDPRKAYIRFLLTEKTRSPFGAAKAASLAWNAFFKNETLSIIRVFTTPIELAGVKLPKRPQQKTGR